MSEVNYSSMSDAEKREQYNARLLVLKESVKLKMLTQDSYDRAQRLLAREIFGETEGEKESK